MSAILLQLVTVTAAQHDPDAPVTFVWTLPSGSITGPGSLRITCTTCGAHIHLAWGQISRDLAARQAARDEIAYAAQLAEKHERFRGPRVAEGPCPGLPALQAFVGALQGERAATWKHHVPGVGIAGAERLRGVAADDQPEHLMVITKSPKDYPGLFVARPWTRHEGRLAYEEHVETAETMEELRAKIPPYYEEVVPLSPGQDPAIAAVLRVPVRKVKLKAALTTLASTEAVVSPEDLGKWREVLVRGDHALRHGQGEEVEAAIAAVDAMAQLVITATTVEA